MTIQTPTNNGTGMLLDEAVLNRLANDFFAALPGGAARLPDTPAALPIDTVQSRAPSIPIASPAPDAGAISSAPALAASPLPASVTPTGVPDTAHLSAPVSSGGRGSQALGVPEAYAPALPQNIPLSGIAGGSSAPPSTPYYFLSEASAYPSAAAPINAAQLEDRIAVQSFALPGAADLKALLEADNSGPVQQPDPASPRFYFLQAPHLSDPQVPAVAPARIRRSMYTRCGGISRSCRSASTAGH